MGEEGGERRFGGFRAGEAGIEAAGGDGHEQNNKIGEDDPAETKGDEALVGEAAAGDGLGNEKAAEQKEQVGADVAEARGEPLHKVNGGNPNGERIGEPGIVEDENECCRTRPHDVKSRQPA